MFDRSISRFITSALLVFCISVSSLAAQALPPAPGDNVAPAPPVANSQEKPQLPTLQKDDFFTKGFARQLLQDQKSIWSSPAHIKKSDLKWIAPLAGGTALLFTRDSQISHQFDGKTSLQNASLKVSNVGTYAAWGVPGAFFALGKFSHNERMADTGEKGFQAEVYSTIAMQSLKFLTNRTRPYLGGDGGFFNGGNSFPSGHAMEAWALAKVVSDEYSDKPLVKIGMYSFATAVSVSRITSQRHYASDVLVGSAMGYLIGKFVMRNHHPVEAQ
jgi:membrane-associated phospholipid phosphatase